MGGLRSRDKVCRDLALRLARAGRNGAAVQVVQAMVDPGQRVLCLADLARLAGETGRANEVRELAEAVREQAHKPDVSDGYRALCVLADAFAVLGDGEAAREAITEAKTVIAAAHLSAEKGEWARLLVKAARLRSRAVLVVRRLGNLAEMARDYPDPVWPQVLKPRGSRDAWQAANVAAAMARARSPDLAADLATRALWVSGGEV